MFDSLQEAIDLGDAKKNRDNDGGVPVFYKTAVAYGQGQDVEWKDEIHVRIFNKGDPKNIMERQKRPEDEQRWPEHWKAYLANEEPDIDGIPLADFPKITPAERERCKKLHLRSVEDLADYPDGQVQDLGKRGHALQKAAREFIEYKAGESITDLKKRIADLERVVTLQKEVMSKEQPRVTDRTTDDTKRSDGDKSPKADLSNERVTESSGPCLSNSGNDVSAPREKGLASTGQGTRIRPDTQPADV